MLNTELSIVTGWGNHLGTGHIQRMATLADYINSHTSMRAFIVSEGIPEFIPGHLHDCRSRTIRPGKGIIIRDKRDSRIDEMTMLKENGRVITVDDCGPGRDLADRAIDLLPNLNYSINQKGLFIYGYSFSDSIRRLGNQTIRKDIDYALYCGIHPSREIVDFFLSLVPEKSSCAILAGEASFLMNNGVKMPLVKSYAETLLSTRILISHFGITLYEGQIAQCRLVTINPTEYHSQLSDKAASDLHCINLGVIGDIDREKARATLSKAMGDDVPESINPAKISDAIEEGLDLFMSQIQPFME
ncbi:MAG: hypothetical protein KA369_02220 [Spirochaetes bacterium]|nr:hypothetical protein [Spirochaetota bacterium]